MVKSSGSFIIVDTLVNIQDSKYTSKFWWAYILYSTSSNNLVNIIPCKLDYPVCKLDLGVVLILIYWYNVAYRFQFNGAYLRSRFTRNILCSVGVSRIR